MTATATQPDLLARDALYHLDAIAAQARETDGVMAAWQTLMSVTANLHRKAQGQDWINAVRTHRVAEMAWQDPFTSWSYRKPRGYAGDARLIDFIYGHPAVQSLFEATTLLGRDVFTFCHGTEACVAVRERRRLLARFIDATVERVKNAEIFAVACGHLREIELARRSVDVGRFVALDQDEESLHELMSAYETLNKITVANISIGRFAARPNFFGKFDLIYAAGLYDYLNQKTAGRLTATLFSCLKPGGRLLFANFASNLHDKGYMSSLMNWHLIFREDSDMQAMLDGLPRDEVKDTRVFRGNNGAIIYAIAARA